MLNIAISLEPEELDWLLIKARADGVSESHVVRSALRKLREESDPLQIDGIVEEVCLLLDDEGRFSRRH